MDKNSKIFVAGHNGLVGSAISRALEKRNFKNVIMKIRQELNLLDEQAVSEFFKKEKPEYVYIAAAKVGGILANKTCPADFIYQNLKIETNLIHHSYLNNIKKLLFLGSSCIYPRNAHQPIAEESLLTGALEPTNDAYAIAKIAGIKMCQSYNKQYGTNFISVMPTNLYGPNDNFDLAGSHVLPALIRKFDDAKRNGVPEVEVWGSGEPMREFLHVDDLAEACIYLMENYNENEIINIGTGSDISIKNLSKLIKEIVGFKGEIVWDKTKPDGTPRKLLSIKKMSNLGWKAKINIKDGIKETYSWYLKSTS